jgi:hypothetical protein
MVHGLLTGRAWSQGCGREATGCEGEGGRGRTLRGGSAGACRGAAAGGRGGAPTEGGRGAARGGSQGEARGGRGGGGAAPTPQPAVQIRSPCRSAGVTAGGSGQAGGRTLPRAVLQQHGAFPPPDGAQCAARFSHRACVARKDLGCRDLLRLEHAEEVDGDGRRGGALRLLLCRAIQVHRRHEEQRRDAGADRIFSRIIFMARGTVR